LKAGDDFISSLNVFYEGFKLGSQLKVAKENWKDDHGFMSIKEVPCCNTHPSYHSALHFAYLLSVYHIKGSVLYSS
jgi:hypothetical protein